MPCFSVLPMPLSPGDVAETLLSPPSSTSAAWTCASATGFSSRSASAPCSAASPTATPTASHTSPSTSSVMSSLSPPKLTWSSGTPTPSAASTPPAMSSSSAASSSTSSLLLIAALSLALFTLRWQFYSWRATLSAPSTSNNTVYPISRRHGGNICLWKSGSRMMDVRRSFDSLLLLLFHALSLGTSGSQFWARSVFRSPSR